MQTKISTFLVGILIIMPFALNTAVATMDPLAELFSNPPEPNHAAATTVSIDDSVAPTTTTAPVETAEPIASAKEAQSETFLNDLPKSGPEVALLVFVASAGAYFWRKSKRLLN